MRVFKDNAGQLGNTAKRSERVLDELVWQSSTLRWKAGIPPTNYNDMAIGIEPPIRTSGDRLFDWAIKQAVDNPFWPDCARYYFVQQRRKLKGRLRRVLRRHTP